MTAPIGVDLWLYKFATLATMDTPPCSDDVRQARIRQIAEALQRAYEDAMTEIAIEADPLGTIDQDRRFHDFLTDPTTAAKLDKALAEDARIDARQTPGREDD